MDTSTAATDPQEYVPTEAELAERARLEAEVARRRAEREAKGTPPRQADPPTLGQTAGSLSVVRAAEAAAARLREAGDLLPDDGEEEHPAVTAGRKEKNRVNFAADVTENGIEELAGWPLDQIMPEDLHRAVGGFARNAINNGRYRTLVLYGPSGRGKTVAALTIADLILEHSTLSVRVVSHPRYVSMQYPGAERPYGMSQAAFTHRYKSCDVLVLDDLGAGKDTTKGAREFVVEATYDLINARVNSPGKFTIVTTNIEDDLAIGKVFGDATRSRLLTRAVPQLVDGPDRREPITFGR